MGAMERCIHPYDKDVKMIVSFLEEVEFPERKYTKQNSKDNDELLESKCEKLMS